MDDVFDKPRRLVFHVPGWVGFMLDVLVWQVRKQKAARGEETPDVEAVLEALFVRYFIEQKQAILELLNDEAERELLTSPLQSGLAPAGLFRFAGQLRARLTNACPDRKGARCAPRGRGRTSHAVRHLDGADGGGVSPAGVDGRSG